MYTRWPDSTDRRKMHIPDGRTRVTNRHIQIQGRPIRPKSAIDGCGVLIIYHGATIIVYSELRRGRVGANTTPIDAAFHDVQVSRRAAQVSVIDVGKAGRRRRIFAKSGGARCGCLQSLECYEGALPISLHRIGIRIPRLDCSAGLGYSRPVIRNQTIRYPGEKAPVGTCRTRS